VDFTFSPEQEALRETVHDFLGRETPSSYVRAMIDDRRGFTDEVWAKMAELGWLGILLPESCGGMGMGLVDLVIVQEELGRLPLPGPFLSSAVCATLVARALGEQGPLAELASGQKRATLALEEVGTGDPLERIATTAAGGGRRGGVHTLEGLKPFVIDGHTADLILVVAREPGGGLATFAVEGAPTEAVPALDVTRKLARLALSGQEGRRIGPAGDQRPLLARAVDDIGVALCAETVGACSRALEMAVDYARQRVQFGRPIATFQVIKHKIVDMLHALELSRVATHYAAWASDADDAHRAEAAAMAKGFVGEAANAITADNIQVHGGVGFTWDVDCHLLFRRAKQNDVLFGGQAWQRQRLTEMVLSRL